MKKVRFCCLLFVVFLSTAANFESAIGGENSEYMPIAQITTRDTAQHNIFFGRPVPQNEGCTHNDRAILVESTDGGKGMLSVALLAFSMGIDVQIRVEGCTAVNDPTNPSVTSPMIVKFEISR